MDRNFFRRNEACFPIRQKPLKQRLMKDLKLFLADNCQAWVLHGDGSYEKLQPAPGEAPVSSQQKLLKSLSS
jgi:polyphosphate kinase